ncbi:MAG: dethiobiotin synthase [Leptospirales bacterium]
MRDSLFRIPGPDASLSDFPVFDLVLGTDTGVGKTIVSAFLVRKSFREGKSPYYMKPALTGGRPDAPDSDPVRCAGLSGISNLPVACLYAFPEPIDPMTAAARAGESIDPVRIRREVRNRASTNALIVEGAGGVLSPFFPDGGGILSAFTVQDFQNIRVHLVSHPHLGALSQVLVTIRFLGGISIFPTLHLVYRPGFDPYPLASKLNPGTLRRLLPDCPMIVHDSPSDEVPDSRSE